MRSINQSFQITVKVLFIIQLLAASLVDAEAKQVINVAYLAQEQKAPPALSNLDPFIKNKGESGAELAIVDNNTTGQFTGQQFVLKKFIVPLDGNVVDVSTKILLINISWLL